MRSLLVRTVSVAIAYAVVGSVTVLLSLRFSIPSPIFPAAGVAAGAVIVWGVRMLPAVFVGRLLLSLFTAGTFGPSTYSLPFEAALALGASLQAGFGGLLVRRLIGPTDALDSGGRVVLLLALVGPASCWIAPAIGVPELLSNHRVSPGDDLGYLFYKWWVGDSVGAMWVAPMYLPLFSRFRSMWRSRRLTAVGALLSMLLLLGTALASVTDREKRRLEEQFEGDAVHQAATLRTELARVTALATGLRHWTDERRSRPELEALAAFALEQLPPGATFKWAGGSSVAALDASSGLSSSFRYGWFSVHTPGKPSAEIEVPLQAMMDRSSASGTMPVCIADTHFNPVHVLWGSASICGGMPKGLHHDELVMTGGRLLLFRAIASSQYAAQDRSAGIWTVDALALAGSMFVIAFVLVVTGRAQRVEELVHERTVELTASEERLRSVIQSAGVGIIYASPNGVIEQVNSEATRLTGVVADEAPAVHLAELVRPDQADSLRSDILATLRGEVVAAREAVLLPRHGTPVDALVRFAVARINDQPRHVVCVLHDLTDLRRLESSESARTLAERESRAKSEFVARMSHELRTPLNAILGFAQLIRARPDDSETARDDNTARIEQAGWHLLAMIEDILLLGRLEGEPESTRRLRVDVNALVSTGLALVKPQAAQREIELVWCADRRNPQILGDPTRTQQVLLNFFTNGIKYNRHGGALEVSIAESGNEWGMAVADQGAGLSAVQLQELFIPFNRLGQEKTNIPGTGIGLVISKKLAELMGGRIQVSTDLGNGSRFTLWLPKASSHERDFVLKSSELVGDVSLAGTVLYVEDNEVNVLLMQAVLENDEELRFLTCGTARVALELLALGGIDLVLLDLGLPDMAGQELLRRIQADFPAVAPRVIVVSADAADSTREVVMRAGAFAMVSKPFEVLELRRAIATALASVEESTRLEAAKFS